MMKKILLLLICTILSIATVTIIPAWGEGSGGSGDNNSECQKNHRNNIGCSRIGCFKVAFGAYGRTGNWSIAVSEAFKHAAACNPPFSELEVLRALHSTKEYIKKWGKIDLRLRHLNHLCL